MARRLYVAYGSNLNKEQMRHRCPGARLVGTSTIPEYELIFKGSKTGAYLTIERKAGGQVPVGIWSVTESDELGLDRYEGCPTFYYKKEITLPVQYKSGAVRKRDCFVYIMHEERKVGIPSAAYIETCLDGYLDFDFAPAPLVIAYKKARREVIERAK